MIQEDFKKWIIPIKEKYLKENNAIHSNMLIKSAVKKAFPEVVNLIDEKYDGMFREIMYCILRDIPEIPLCPRCGKKKPLRNYRVGFQVTCSKKCGDKYFSNYRRSQISKGKKKYEKKKFLNNETETFLSQFNYDDIIRDKPNYITIKNYCKHGDVTIYGNTAKKIYERGHSSFCIKCNREIIDLYQPSEEETINFLNIFSDFYKKHNFALKYDWWLVFYPKELRILFLYYKKYFQKYFEDEINIDTMTLQQWHEMYYVFLNKLTDRPKCHNLNCNEKVKFHIHGIGYRKFCDVHSVGYMQSAAEIELGLFLKTVDSSLLVGNRKIIGKEVDYMFPTQKICIEFNGLWFHSTAYKKPFEHYEKYIACRDAGYRLLTIWEDDWRDKELFVSDLINRQVHPEKLIQIQGKELELRKNVLSEDIKEFIEQNSLELFLKTSHRYGLYKDDELLMILCGGKSRSKTKKTGYEINRICSKVGYRIIGGADILIDALVEDVGKDITCKVNCDNYIEEYYQNKFKDITQKKETMWWWFDKQNKYNMNEKIPSAKYRIYNSGLLTMHLK